MVYSVEYDLYVSLHSLYYGMQDHNKSIGKRISCLRCNHDWIYSVDTKPSYRIQVSYVSLITK